jgi:hypothetical protein
MANRTHGVTGAATPSLRATAAVEASSVFAPMNAGWFFTKAVSVPALARLVTGEERETVPRKYRITALGPCETGLLDVANCERAEFVVALADGEAAGTRIET